jgi:nucleolin
MSSKKRKTTDGGSSAEGNALSAADADNKRWAAPPVEAFNNPRTVYVEGLPFDASEEDVQAFFRDVGPVRSLRLPRWHDSGRLRGYGHVEFGDVEAAARALELNGGCMEFTCCNNIIFRVYISCPFVR